jgi:quercetin dioxygenase-like cupin family protein
MGIARFILLVIAFLASPLVNAKGLFQASGRISELRKSDTEITFRFVGNVSFPRFRPPAEPIDVPIRVGDWTRPHAMEERDAAPEIERLYAKLTELMKHEEGVRISLDNPAFFFSNAGKLTRISGTYIYAVRGFTAAERAAAAAKPLTEIRQRAPLTGDEGKEVLLGSAIFPAGTTTGRHTHPGDEYATVLEGTLEILVEGQPSRRVREGESYHNARNVVHETRNVGAEAARVLSTFVIDKGQPVMVPAAAE